MQYYVPDRPTAVLHAGVVASVATVIMFGSPLASLVCIIILLLIEDAQVKESDNESDQIPGCGLIFGSLVLESDGILVSKFDGTYRWVLTDLYY